MVDRLEVLNRHVVGNCSAVPAEGDETVVAQLCKEVQKAQVGPEERLGDSGAGTRPPRCAGLLPRIVRFSDQFTRLWRATPMHSAPLPCPPCRNAA